MRHYGLELVSLALLIALWVAQTPAWADEPVAETATDCASSDDPAFLFKKGKQYYASANYQAAYGCYQRSWKLRPAYDIAANLGNVEVEFLKQYAAGARHLSYALDNLPGSLDPDLRAAAERKIRARLDEALTHVGRVRAEVTPAGAEVFVDGNSFGRAPLAREMYLEPGAHKVEARLAGHEPARAEVSAEAGVTEKVTLELTPLAGSAGGSGGGPKLALAISGGVLSLAALGAGVGLMVASSSAGTEREEGLAALAPNNAQPCRAGTPFSAECADIEDAGKRELVFRGTGIGLLAAGGALAVGTLLYVLLAPDGAGDNGADAAARGKGVALRPSLALSPQVGLLGLQGSF